MTRPLLPDDLEIAELNAPYDAARLAGEALDAAEAQARATGKRVLAVFGADWCPDARRFASVLAAPALESFLTERFAPVLINVGRYDRNLDLAARYGLATIEGAPAVVVADADRRVINAGGVYDWRTARSRRPQEIADFLAVYAEAPSP